MLPALSATRPQLFCRRYFFIALGFGLFATIVSLWKSWVPSLWGDEVATLLSATRPFETLIPMLFHVDAVHGLYYIAMQGWVDLVGSDPFLLRLPSAFAVGAAVMGTTLLVSYLNASLSLATITGFVMTFLPRVTWIGIDARSFAFTATAGVWLTLFLVWMIQTSRSGEHPRRKIWVIYTLSFLISSYFFLYFVVLLLAHFALIFMSRSTQKFQKSWFISTTITLVGVLPLAILAFLERNQISYLLNEELRLNDIFFGPGRFETVQGIFAWIFIGITLVHWIIPKLKRGKPSSNTSNEKHLPTLTTLSIQDVAICWFFIPLSAFVTVNAFFSLYTPRYSAFFVGALAILIASGINTLATWITFRLQKFKTLIASVLVVTFIGTLLPTYANQRVSNGKNGSDWQEIGQVFVDHASPNDAVIFDPSPRFSKRPQHTLRAYPKGFKHVSAPTLKTPYYNNIGWEDKFYSISDAHQLGRFDSVTTLWFVQDASGNKPSTYGVDDLHAIGFTPTEVSFETSRSIVTQWQKQ